MTNRYCNPKLSQSRIQPASRYVDSIQNKPVLKTIVYSEDTQLYVTNRYCNPKLSQSRIQPASRYVDNIQNKPALKTIVYSEDTQLYVTNRYCNPKLSQPLKSLSVVIHFALQLRSFDNGYREMGKCQLAGRHLYSAYGTQT